MWRHPHAALAQVDRGRRLAPPSPHPCSRGNCSSKRHHFCHPLASGRDIFATWCCRGVTVPLQVDEDPLTEECPVFDNDEFPLSVPVRSSVGTVFLGSMEVRGLAGKWQRLVFPTISRVPGTIRNATTACILAFVDSGMNVLELNDGPENVQGTRVPMTDIARCAVRRVWRRLCWPPPRL
jgi:hypothetical protein